MCGHHNYSKRIFFISFLCVILVGCHPPVFNQHLRTYQNTVSWIGSPLDKLILYKGKPTKIYFMGNSTKKLVSSEYWIQGIDRFELLYQNYGRVSMGGHHGKDLENIYKSSNQKGVWLFVYSKPIRNYQTGLRECTEYYQIDRSALIIKSGFLTNNLGDHKHCSSPIANFSLRQKKMATW
ncbi:MAG: hypothetical protein ACJAS9_003488 [Polaribacter sp.]|jgi:hypothetical protein